MIMQGKQPVAGKDVRGKKSVKIWEGKKAYKKVAVQ